MKTLRTDPKRTVRRLSTVLLFGAIFTLMVASPFGAQSAWALPGETDAGLTISNTASIDYSVGGAPQTALPSNPVEFLVDHKVRPVVASAMAGNQSVVAGSADQYLTFTVSNEGNTAAADTLALNLSYELDAASTLAPAIPAITYYLESGANTGLQITEDTLVTAVSVPRDSSVTVHLVGSIPGGATALQTATYHLIATSALGEAATDGLMVSDVVFADDAGTATSDDPFEGQHSDNATFEVIAVPLTAVKTSTVLDDYVGSNFPIPGALVRYTIVVTNTSTSPVTGVTVNDPIPANTDYAVNSVTINSTGYLDSTAEVTYVAGPPETLAVTVPDLAPGASATVTFNVTIN